MTDRQPVNAGVEPDLAAELAQKLLQARPAQTQGSGKADFYRISSRGAAYWIKDFSAKPWWGRLWGRWQIARELRAYRALAGLEFLPATAVRVHGLALAVSWIDGEQLIHHAARFREADRWMEALEKQVESMHRLGWAHLDLRGRHNVLIDREGQLRIVDFASAQPLSTAFGLLRRWMLSADRGALLKWKRMLLLSNWSAAELRQLRRQRQLRFWWPFNRKGVGRTH